MPRTQLHGNQVASDSLTGDDVLEESLILSKLPFSASGFVASNAKDAIIEAASNSSGFLYGDLDKDITIPSGKGLLMVGAYTGDNEILIEGELVSL